MPTYSQAEIDAFKAAMLKNPGVLEMDIADRHYKFSSLEEMRAQLADMERHSDSATAPPRTRYGATSKGLC